MSEYRIKLRSNYLDSTANLDVIMPNPFVGHDPERFYCSGKKYPVLWLLHGGKGRLDDWITYSTVPRLGVWRNTIIIAPEAPNSDFINQEHVGEGYRYTDFFFHELMPFVYHWFPASDRPEDNFLAGNDMGGDAVWRYGLLHPEAFACIAPIASTPPDYRFLEPYRQMEAAEFCRRVGEGRIAGGCFDSLTRRALNSIGKYRLIGDFLDSVENTAARFWEAEETGRLPKVYLPYRRGDQRCEDFQKQVEAGESRNIHFCQWDSFAGSGEFLDRAVEEFMNYAGLKEVESRQKGLPILPGVHDLEDDIGITIH